MKTNELTGAALDWAVAKCEGFVEAGDEPWEPGQEPFSFSTDWAQGGPIIEASLINLETRPDPEGIYWVALMPNSRGDGPTPLIAAMRCYVASKLGDEIEVPSELAA